jgi:hypothetical protein
VVTETSKRRPLDRIAALLAQAETWSITLPTMRAIRFLEVEGLTEREDRLLRLAEEFGLDPETSAAFQDHVRVYLGLVFSSWASNRALTETTRTAAFCCAVALATSSGENLREVMGLHEKLRGLAREGVDDELAAIALRVAAGNRHGALRTLEPVLARLEVASDEGDERPTRAHG